MITVISGTNRPDSNSLIVAKSCIDLLVDKNIDAQLFSLASLKDVIIKINSKNSSIGKMINDDELYNNVNDLIVDSKSLVNDIKDNPTKYLRAYFAAKKK